MSKVLSKEKRYIIVRYNENCMQYYDGARLYGKDKDNILRICKVNFSDDFHSVYCTSKERCEELYAGMKKYGEIDKNYNYEIAEIVSQIVVNKYIEF